MRIHLAVKAGPHQGQVFEFQERANFIVGRSKRAHFRLPIKDKSISRIHFMIEMNPPQCRVVDMGSTNGTRVNGQRVTTADLKDGDQITAGKTVLVVSVIPVEEPALAPTGPYSTPVVKTLVAPLMSESPAMPTPSPPERLSATDEYPARQDASAQARTGCRVCGGLLPDGDRAIPPGAIPLCADCQGRIRNQSQPIPGYQVVRKLGQGGMGVVYQALRNADGRLVALKTIKPAIAPTPTDVERFLREARILSELDHPNIVAFHEVGETNGLLHFAMDFVPGRDAAQLLRQQCGPLPIGLAVDLVCQLLQALDYSHAKGFVHRDVKPANMLVAIEGGRDTMRLSDFGLARIYQTSKMSGLTMNGQLGGTAAFMAPDQVTELRDVRPPADQYSAAATLYNLLTDRSVYDFPAGFHAKIMMILLDDPVPIRSRRQDIPEALAAAIHRALARNPQARFPSVRELRRALIPFAR